MMRTFPAHHPHLALRGIDTPNDARNKQTNEGTKEHNRQMLMDDNDNNNNKSNDLCDNYHYNNDSYNNR